MTPEQIAKAQIFLQSLSYGAGPVYVGAIDGVVTINPDLLI